MRAIFAAILLIFSANAFANSLNLTTDSTTYLIGEQVVLKLEFKGEDGIIWPNFQDTLTKALEIVETSSIDTLGNGHYQQKLMITSWDSGYFVVPPILVKNSQSAPILLRFNTVSINPQEDIKPIKDQLDTPFIFDEIKTILLIGLLILVVLIGLIILGIYWYRKQKNKTPEAPIVPARPVMEVLLERFEKLEKSKIWEQGQEKEFHTELSLILRAFLEYKFKINALEETTSIITKQLNSLGTERVFRDEVTHILNFSDMVKFAKQKGIYSQHENALSILKGILQKQEDNTIG